MSEQSSAERVRRRPWLLLAALVAALAAVAAGCGGGGDEGGGEEAATTEAPPAETAAPADTGAPAETSAAGGEAIKVGILSDCEGAFGSWFSVDIGGAQAAFIKYAGATANSEDPLDGISGASVAGVPIEIAGYGCSNDTADKAVEEARRLVEQVGVDVLIGPLSGDEGIAVANYSKQHPDKTFINGTSGAQDTTLKVQSPNFFRYGMDGAQWSAGLGDYAYNTLGWRTAATIGDDYSFAYTSLAGFIAEFCAVGGEVTQRIWPPLGETDYASYVAQIPDDVDGVMSAVGGAGLIAFIKAYENQRGQIDPDKFMGNIFWSDPVVLKEIGDVTVGSVAAGSTAADSTDPAAVEYVEALAPYPDVQAVAASVFAYNNFNAAWALVKGLEAVNGDISDGQKALQEALTQVTLDGGYGPIELDDNRQAITTNYVQQLVPDISGDGLPDAKTILQIPEVDQAFGGVFTPETPPPDRTNPECVKLDSPPPWVGNAVPVDYGS